MRNGSMYDEYVLKSFVEDPKRTASKSYWYLFATPIGNGLYLFRDRRSTSGKDGHLFAISDKDEATRRAMRSSGQRLARKMIGSQSWKIPLDEYPGELTAEDMYHCINSDYIKRSTASIAYQYGEVFND